MLLLNYYIKLYVRYLVAQCLVTTCRNIYFVATSYSPIQLQIYYDGHYFFHPITREEGPDGK